MTAMEANATIMRSVLTVYRDDRFLKKAAINRSLTAPHTKSAPNPASSVEYASVRCGELIT